MSRIRRLLALATEHPWAITPAKLDAIGELLTVRSTGEGYSEDEVLARLGGEAGAPAKAAVGRGVAVLPLYGVIAPRMDSMSEMSGGTSTERFGAWFDAAMADDSVSAIVIDANSPGGSVLGVEELTRKIFAARGRKPITAVVNHMAASAAYWIISACDDIVVTLSAQLGNIGIIAMHADTSEQDAKAGVKVTVLTAGEHKAEGAYGPLTPEAESAMKDLMASYYGYFTKSVAKGRGVGVDAVRNGFGQGRIVTAADAVKMGMADSIGSLDATIARYTSGRSTSRSLPGSRAAKIPDHIAAALLAAPASPLLDAVIEPLTIAASAALEGTGSVSGDAAPVVVPVTEPAPSAKEQKMPEVIAANEVAEQVKAAAEATQKRLEVLSALATEFPAHASLPRWVKEGTSEADARAEVMTQLKAELAAKPRIVSGGRVTAMDEPNEAKRPFANLGEQLSAIIGSSREHAQVDPRLMRINAAVTGSSEGLGSEGGFAVQEDFIPGIMEPVYSTGEVAKRVTKLPVGPNANGVKFNVVDETSRANGSRWGGITMAWGTEGTQGTNSKAKLRPVELNLKKLIGLYPLTDELLQDSTAMQALLEKGFQTELQFMVEDAIINGLGSGQPLGILNSGAVVSQAIEATQTIANSPTFIVANVAKMKSRFPASLFAGAVWLANQELEPTFIQATLGGTSAAFPVYMPANGLSGSPYATILGRPVVFVDYCAAVGTPGDLILTNLGEYAMIDKGGPQTASSIHLRFDFDETVFRITYRCDGQPIWKTAVTPYKGSLTRSPFVTLAVRS